MSGRISTLEERGSRSHSAGGGRTSVGDAASQAKRKRRTARLRAAVDEALVWSWLRRLGGRSSAAKREVPPTEVSGLDRSP